MRIKRVPELLPQLLSYSDETTALNPDDETQMEDITNDILLKAGIVASVDGSDPEEPVTPLEASTKLERDGSRLDKLAALFNLNASTLSEGHDSFTDLIVGMFSDEGSTE
jgi:hypothetical protein